MTLVSLRGRHNKNFNIFLCLILALFFEEFALGRVRTILSGRQQVVLKSGIEFATLMLGYLALFGEYAFGKNSFSVKKKDLTVFILLFLWFWISTYSCLIGLYEGNDIGYVLGDFYKFTSLSMIFVYFYFSIRSISDLKFIIHGATTIYVVFLSFHLLLFFSHVLPIHTLVVTAEYLPVFLPLLLYAALQKEKRRIRFLARVGLAEAPFMVFFCQSFSLLINALSIPIIFIILKKVRSVKKAAFLSISLFFCLIMIFSLFGNVLLSFTESDSYIYSKAVKALANVPLVEKLEMLGGSRLPELVCIAEEFQEHPRKTIAGSGMGSLLSVHTMFLRKARWESTDHFIHSAIGDVLYRSGFLGVGILSIFLLTFARKSFSFYNEPFGVLSSTFSVQLLVNYTTSMPLFAPFMVLCLLFVGILLLEDRYESHDHFRCIST